MKLLDAPSQILNVINNKVRQPKYQVRQTKRQVRNFNQKSTPKKQMLIYAVLSRCNFCRKFTHFFGVPFTGLKNMVAYQKWQIWGMKIPINNCLLGHNVLGSECPPRYEWTSNDCYSQYTPAECALLTRLLCAAPYVCRYKRGECMKAGKSGAH